MAARKPTAQKRARPAATAPTLNFEETLRLMPSSGPHDAEAAIAIHRSLLMARAIMEEHFGINADVLKNPQQIDFALRVLAMMRQETQNTRATMPSNVRDAAQKARRELKRRNHIVRLLQEHRGNVSEVARVMGKARNQIDRWLKRYEIDAGAYRGE